MAIPSQMKLIPALVLGLFANYVSASGFQLIEQNASGLGNAYAGSAAIADNASTIFYNPAGMTQLQDREFSGGMAAIGTSFKFTDQGSTIGASFPGSKLPGSGNGGDGGGWGFVPNAYLSWALNKDLYVGVGMGAPFGMKTEYDNPWIGAAQATMFDVKTYNINPSIAYRVNDKVSVGAGLSWQRLTADYTRQVGAVVGGGGALNFSASPLKLDLQDDSWGWNVGALFTVSPDTKIGVSYRSTVSYDLTGNINIVGATPVPSSDRAATASLKLPDMFILSGTHQLNTKWQLLGDVSWTGWSTIPKLDIIRTSDGSLAQTLDTEFRDAWRVAVGANYQYSSDVKLKMGIAYDQTPVKSAATRLVSLPDNNRLWLSGGAQWTPSKGSVFDFGVTYLYLKDSKIDNDQRAPAGSPSIGRGRVTGSYAASAWILGVQYSHAF
ncbi:OmpP1/FadL family transporter [Rhodoferax fermentans]|uniref:Long-chain fatty acid transporter n=1 Tax=Rhodoferax fermentans TaxID=28066 RepID=A0A1T1AU47_RHOFE|nr:outer membrane protein transport protein [Rhodoferax fermentans]MBK1683036.1 long-chain fatty acid transporter [Rhodoferax fermentans]OOV07468.1 long-chain fatty acid transporter [Rhodoferax fermentans]